MRRTEAGVGRSFAVGKDGQTRSGCEQRRVALRFDGYLGRGLKAHKQATAMTGCSTSRVVRNISRGS